MLGTARYREIEEAHPMTPLAATLHALKRQGELDFDDVDLLSRMVDAVICKVAIMLPGQRIRRSSGRAGRRSSTACSGGGRRTLRWARPDWHGLSDRSARQRYSQPNAAALSPRMWLASISPITAECLNP